MTTLVIATRNDHKVGEIQAILGRRYHYLTLRDFPSAPAVVEDAGSFAGNATKKAVELAEWLCAFQHIPKSRVGDDDYVFVLADDSGLEVDALQGAPGVHSARFASLDADASAMYARGAGNSPDAANNAKLLRLLRDVPEGKRAARFRCVLALTPVVDELLAGGESPVCQARELELVTEIFDGTCEGRIALRPVGSGGFGYDPLFLPNGFEVSFGELSAASKNEISHRSRALEKLRIKMDLARRH